MLFTNALFLKTNSIPPVLCICSVTQLEQQLEKVQKEQEIIKEQRNQQKQLADSNGRQRDMYRILLSQSTGFNLPPQGELLSNHITT